MLLGDIGQTALLASRNELHRAELSLFRPIKCMLASPEPTAEAIWERFAVARSRPIAGVSDVGYSLRRRQIRRHSRATASQQRIAWKFSRAICGASPINSSNSPSSARKFSRRSDSRRRDHGVRAREKTYLLRSAETARPKKRRRRSVRRRFRRCAGCFCRVRFVWLNGRSLLKTPLRERRELLRSLKLPPQFQIAEIFPAHSAARDRSRRFKARAGDSNEGLMIKDPESFYSPGRRGMFWFKLKKELATLDVVVVAAELGHGKRNHVLSDYTFAVRDETSGELLADRQSLQRPNGCRDRGTDRAFQTKHIVDHGRYREVKPDIVLEVAFDSDPAEHASCERSGAAFSADQSDPARQKRRRDRYAGLRAQNWPNDHGNGTVGDGVGVGATGVTITVSILSRRDFLHVGVKSERTPNAIRMIAITVNTALRQTTPARRRTHFLGSNCKAAIAFITRSLKSLIKIFASRLQIRTRKNESVRRRQL